MAKAKSRRPTRKAGRKTAKPAARKKTARRAARGTSRRVAARKKSRARRPKKKAPARQARRNAPARQAIARKSAPKRKSAARKASRPPLAARAVARKAPALNRERRIVREDDIVPTPPSSLDLDRSASAARTGRRELHEKFLEHTETSPAVTGGDIDADWESASTVGDEAPGGDNPTPDQDIVDDIGQALGVVYEDNEELKGEKKVSDRDRKRWELDPASSEDYNER